jgi:hypothetical protein
VTWRGKIASLSEIAPIGPHVYFEVYIKRQKLLKMTKDAWQR